jgi:hypothetical protein
MIHCAICRKRIREGEKVIPVMHVVENERRGDFVGNNPTEYVHLSHLTEYVAPPVYGGKR